MKPTITSYQKFMETHTKYSHSPDFNMDRHGFGCVIEGVLEIYENKKTQRSRDYVQGYIDQVGEDYRSEYIYYRTVGGWGIPYIFVYFKREFNG